MCLRTANYVKYKNSEELCPLLLAYYCLPQKKCTTHWLHKRIYGTFFCLLPVQAFNMPIATKNAQRTDYISTYRKSLDVLLPLSVQAFTCRLLLKTHNVQTISAHIGNLLTFFCLLSVQAFACRLLLKTHNVRTISAHIGNLLTFFCLLSVQAFYMPIDTKNAQRMDYISAYRKSLDVLLPTFRIGFLHADCY